MSTSKWFTVFAEGVSLTAKSFARTLAFSLAFVSKVGLYFVRWYGHVACVVTLLEAVSTYSCEAFTTVVYLALESLDKTSEFPDWSPDEPSISLLVHSVSCIYFFCLVLWIGHVRYIRVVERCSSIIRRCVCVSFGYIGSTVGIFGILMYCLIRWLMCWLHPSREW